MNKKAVAGFELMLMIVSIFAFSYMIYLSDSVFEEIPQEIRPQKSFIQNFAENYFKAIKGPLFGRVSASEPTAGCCSFSNNGEQCVTSDENNCAGEFAFGSLCDDTLFCKRGCCYDEETGIYDKNVLKTTCQKSWIDDPFCNLPGARLGCCSLGTRSSYVTEGQCKTLTEVWSIGGNANVNWSSSTNELQCALLSASKEEGACVLGEGDCKFLSEAECLSLGGEFNKGYLCTSSELETGCEPTELTQCFEGLDQVYFVDSCGNKANVYDSSRANDANYWEKKIPFEESCNSDSNDGSKNSEDCGNCNRFLGGICASASTDNFNVEMGDFYCRDTSCTFEGKPYESGESWCVYDGKVGEGDDVVGSRHWRYVCNQGVIKVEPCADYRNEVCLQSSKTEVNGQEIEFNNAACITNNWRQCLPINSEEDVTNDEKMEICKDTVNCMVQEIRIADKFRFDVCVPKYPGGFDLRSERSQETASSVCEMATMTCTVVRKQRTSGGCKYVANKGCLSEEFARQMNNFCTSLGDCGMSVNIEGDYRLNNYKVTKSEVLSEEWIEMLASYANWDGEIFGNMEDYSEYLEAAGILGNPEEIGDTEPETENMILSQHMMGVAGLGTSIFFAAGGELMGYTLTNAILGEAAYGFGQGMMAFGIGMVIGSYVAKSLGLSPLGSTLMSIGAGLVALDFVLLGNPITFWIGVAMIVMSLFFGGSKCKPIEVTFECRNWQPPSGGDKCEECNGDPLKPCSEYRCQSLGTTCKLINKGTENELCVSDSELDVSPPSIGFPDSISSPEAIYEETNEGIRITSNEGGCIDAYTIIPISVQTDKPSICYFDFTPKDLEEMDFVLGGNYYKTEHKTSFNLPDPSHGQSRGLEWSGDLNFFIKCEGLNGQESVGTYNIELCVNQGPDNTAPMIRSFNPINNSPVSYDKTSQKFNIITNELSTCRWDTTDKDYITMGNEMECEDWRTYYGDPDAFDDTSEEFPEDYDYSEMDAMELEEFSPKSPQGYVCSGEMPIEESVNSFYIRCMDQPWLEGTLNESERNPNLQSRNYILRKPDSKINITYLKPSEEIITPVDMAKVELEVGTANGGNYHICSYSFSGYDKMIMMFQTGSGKTHKQTLNLPANRYKIYFKCQDETGDKVQETLDFRVKKDTLSPQIARVWEEGGRITLVTNEPAECSYTTTSCNFDWEEGNFIGNDEVHTFSSKKGEVYHIKCKDGFGNIPTGCSIQIENV